VADITVRKGEMLTHSQLNPAATNPGNKLDGWFTAATGGTQVSAATYFKIFTEDTTFYAQWTPLPDATEDVVLVDDGDVVKAGFKTSTYGGLGSLNSNAGLGPFNYLASQQYDAVVWFATPTEINTAIYSKLEIVVTLTKLDSGDNTKPLKLAVASGRAENAWGGGESTYPEAADTGDLTIEITNIASPGVTLQHNKYGGTADAPVTADFTLTIKSIKLIAPTP